jgi:three-Cys-motif partner protein
VIGEYYPFWWKITSGGPSNNYQFPTAIVELNAATGEVHIEDTHEKVLGSAGHALQLKAGSELDTANLKVVLVEEDASCYSHLKRVMKRRWPSISIREAEGPDSTNSSNVYLLESKLDPALAKIDGIQLGNSLYFFDPLRSVEYSTIRKVARNRMDTPFKTGTEFFIFLFTSDWFLGRDEFAPLPSAFKKDAWTRGEKRTVAEADRLFGNIRWRRHVLNNESIEKREAALVSFYKIRLHKWFRYVLPLPFNPKKNQIFHLILCSNFETGIRMTKDAYASKTGNPRYSPNNEEAYERFRGRHPETLKGLGGGRKRPLQWRLLWTIVRQHEGGVCDYKCSDLQAIEPDHFERQNALSWLSSKGYLKPFRVGNAWDSPLERYTLDWKVLKTNLAVDRPTPLRAMSPEQFKARELVGQLENLLK